MNAPVVKSGLVDNGLHINHPAKSGDVVLRVEFDETEVSNECTSYSLQVGENAHLTNQVIKYLNHHCEPSIRLDVVGNVVIGYALRDLEPGDELTFNYMTMDEKQAQGGMVCLCQSPKCYGVLNGWDGLTREQQAVLAPLAGGFIKERIMNEQLDNLHSIMGDGTMELCNMYIPSGNCHCCKFHFGNWIGLLPGEAEHLKVSDTPEWTPVYGGEGITCQRDPATCTTHKPLDCKMYPFFPYAVEDMGDHYRVLLGAGDQKCAGKGMLISALKGKDISQNPTLPFGEHMYRVAQIGVELFLDGKSDWMRETFAGYVGYSEGYVALVKKGS